MKKKLPIAGKPTSAGAAKPVRGGSKPEFPTRNELYRKAGLLGGATLLAGGLAHADPQAQQAKPQVNAVSELATDGSVDGKPLPKAPPKLKIYRSGGGIGPAEDMWNLADVETFVSWTMAREGKLAIQTNYKLSLDGVSVALDGFDPERNIGFEYVDGHDPEKAKWTPEIKAKLAAWQASKKVAILFIDVRRYPDAAALKGKVVKFLVDVKKAPPAAGRIAQAEPPKAPEKKK
jgi:hypothetical protein